MSPRSNTSQITIPEMLLEEQSCGFVLQASLQNSCGYMTLVSNFNVRDLGVYINNQLCQDEEVFNEVYRYIDFLCPNWISNLEDFISAVSHEIFTADYDRLTPYVMNNSFGYLRALICDLTNMVVGYTRALNDHFLHCQDFENYTEPIAQVVFSLATVLLNSHASHNNYVGSGGEQLNCLNVRWLYNTFYEMVTDGLRDIRGREEYVRPDLYAGDFDNCY